MGAYDPAKKEAVRAKLVQLRADIKPGDPVSLLKAGYWAEVLHAIGVSPDTDASGANAAGARAAPERR